MIVIVWWLTLMFLWASFVTIKGIGRASQGMLSEANEISLSLHLIAGILSLAAIGWLLK